MGRLQNNPSIGWVPPKTTFIFWRRNLTSRWVDFKTTHQLDGCHPKSTHACPIAWGNKKKEEKKKKK
jgi:hypothetical protein